MKYNAINLWETVCVPSRKICFTTLFIAFRRRNTEFIRLCNREEIMAGGFVEVIHIYKRCINCKYI